MNIAEKIISDFMGWKNFNPSKIRLVENKIAESPEMLADYLFDLMQATNEVKPFQSFDKWEDEILESEKQGFAVIHLFERMKMYGCLAGVFASKERRVGALASAILGHRSQKDGDPDA